MPLWLTLLIGAAVLAAASISISGISSGGGT